LTEAGEYERDKADASERLLNITLALISTNIGMTKAELFSAIRDYRNDIEKGISLKSLEKKFERDKDDLRASGIQLETRILDSDMGDNQETRYIISPSGFQGPQDVKLNATQLQILQLASTVWRQASLSSDAALGLDRLRALGTASPTSDLIGFAPRIKTHESSFSPLTNAITNRNSVSFAYRKPGQSSAETRNLQPWRISHIEGQWIVQGWDIDAEDYRNFLLKRIVSEVTINADEFDAPSEVQVAELQRLLDQHISNNVAKLLVKRDSMAWFHFDLPTAGTSDEEELELQYMDLWLLADELRDYAGDFKVISPTELDKAIKHGYEKVAADHG
jgi:proteasome accessory factor B